MYRNTVHAEQNPIAPVTVVALKCAKESQKRSVASEREGVTNWSHKPG